MLEFILPETADISQHLDRRHLQGTASIDGMGRAAGNLQMESLPIFAWLYFWQLPHFLAMGWYCREDYRNAGFRMLSYRDIAGQRTSFHMQLNGVLLLLTSLLVWHFNQAGIFFLAGSVFLGLIFLLGIRKNFNSLLLKIRRGRCLSNP